MLLFARLQQAESHQRTLRQVKQLFNFFGKESPHLALTLCFGQFSQINSRQRDGLKRAGDLHGFSVQDFEGHTQHVMAADDFVEALSERRYVKRARQTDRSTLNVRAAPETESFYEPHTLLRE